MRGRSNSRMRSGQRGIYTTANSLLSPSSFSPSTFLSEIEDRRFYHPDPDAVELDVRGRPVRFDVHSVVRPPSVRVHRRSFVARDYYTNSFRGFQVPVGIKYRSMFPVVTCIRRKMRRSVLFALGRTGKGGRSKFRHRNSRSDVVC